MTRVEARRLALDALEQVENRLAYERIEEIRKVMLEPCEDCAALLDALTEIESLADCYSVWQTEIARVAIRAHKERTA